MVSNGPAFRRKLGRMAVAVFLNDEQGEPWFNVKFSRYSVKEQRWKEVNSFYRDELPLIAKLSDIAYAWLWDQEVNVTSDVPEQAEA